MIFSVLVTYSCVIAYTPGVYQFLISNHGESSGLMTHSLVDIEGYAGTNTAVRTVLKERNLLSSSTRKGMQQQIIHNCTNHFLFLTL